MKAGGIIISICIATGIVLCAGFKRLQPGTAMNACLKEVKEIYDRMYDVLPREDKVYHFGYRIISTLNAKDKNGKSIVSRSDIDLFSTKDQYRFISRDISVYQDKDNRFTVLPAQKNIYWGDSDMGLVKGDRLGRLKKIQDTIFSYADAVECRPLQQGYVDKVVKVKLRKKFADYMQINQVTYFLDSKHKALRGLQIDYPDTRDVVALEFIFNETDYDYKKLNLTPVKSLFVEGRALKEPYKNYKLIDVRKKN